MLAPLKGFFSYRRERDDDPIKRVHHLVEAELSVGLPKAIGFSLYRDVAHNRQGEHFYRRIARSISECCTFCWLQTPWWFESGICQVELAAFEEHVEQIARRSGLHATDLRSLMLNPIRFRAHCDETPKQPLAAELFEISEVDLGADLITASTPAAFDLAARRIGRNAHEDLRELLAQVGGVAAWQALTSDRRDFVDRWTLELQKARSSPNLVVVDPSAAEPSYLPEQRRLARIFNGGEVTRRDMVLVPAGDGRSCFFLARQPYLGRHFTHAQARVIAAEGSARGISLPNPQQSVMIEQLTKLLEPHRRQLRMPEVLPFWAEGLDGTLHLVGEGEMGFIFLVEDV